MRLNHIAAAMLAAVASSPVSAAEDFIFNHEWTFSHVFANGSRSLGSEIVAFDYTNNRLWVAGTDANAANVGLGGVDILDMNGNLVGAFDLHLVGGVNSVAVANNRAAVAITAPTKTDPGVVRFYNATSFGVLGDVTVGANPDSVTYTPDGSRLLVANEGEPSSYLVGPSGDPEGSISIINAVTLTAQTAGFSAFNGQAAALKAAGVRLSGPNASVAQDLEPEYVAVSADGSTAFATLQEANSVAIIDIASATVLSIEALGLKDHSLPGNGLDVSDQDGAASAALNGNIRNWNVFGVYMPDGIAGFVNGGDQYYVTANEGDSRADWPGGNDEFRVSSGTIVIDPALDAVLDVAHGTDYKSNNDKLSRLNVTPTGDTDGDGDQDQLQVFGARSFSILDDQGNIVFDSGDALEQIIKAEFPALWDDSRSDNKGPEPESAVVGTVGASQLLFLGLERANAIMVWDITDLAAITFIDMLFHAGDVGPEGLSFITTGGLNFLAVANEVSETTTLYSIQSLQPVPLPAAVWLFGTALAGLGAARRRKIAV